MEAERATCTYGRLTKPLAVENSLALNEVDQHDEAIMLDTTVGCADSSRFFEKKLTQQRPDVLDESGVGLDLTVT